MSNSFKNSELSLSEQEMFEIVDHMQLEGYFDGVSDDVIEENEAFEEVSNETMERITKRVYETLKIDRPVQEKHPFNQEAQENQETLVTKSFFKNNQFWNTRRQWIVGIVGVILILGVAYNKQVFADIEKVLHFIPGFGVVQEDAGVQRYKLDFPITTKVKDGQIKIESIFVDGDQTIIHMLGKGTDTISSFVLKNKDGKEYSIHAISISESANEWSGEYWYKGQIQHVEQATIEVRNGSKDSSSVSIPVHLTKAESYTNYDQMWPTQTVNGLSVTAIVNRNQNLGSIAFVTTQSDRYTVASYGLDSYPVHKDKKVTISDSSGSSVKITVPDMTGGTVDTGEFTFPTLANEDGKTDLWITIPEISLEYKDEKTVPLPVPVHQAEQMNQTIQLAGYPLTFTKIEPIKQGEAVRIYVDPHYNATANRTLYTFTLDNVKMGNDYSMTKVNDQTGAIEYFEIPVKDDQKQVRVTLTQPRVLVRGPWVFEVKK